MGKSIKDVGRKADKKREHLKSMPYVTTPGPRVIREPIISVVTGKLVSPDVKVTPEQEALLRQGMSWAQVLMREDMEAGLHKASYSLAAVNPPSHDMDSSLVSGGAPRKLNDVLDEVIGAADSSPGVTELAYQVINEHGEGLVLGFREWAIIQRMVEAGIRAGHDAGMGTGLG